jgi:hypothetical protein
VKDERRRMEEGEGMKRRRVQSAGAGVTKKSLR